MSIPPEELDDVLIRDLFAKNCATGARMIGTDLLQVTIIYP